MSAHHCPLGNHWWHCDNWDCDDEVDEPCVLCKHMKKLVIPRKEEEK